MFLPLFEGNWSKIEHATWNYLLTGHDTCLTRLLPFTSPHYWLLPSILAQALILMAKKALSEHVKKSKQSQLKESKLQEAVDVYRREQSKQAYL